MRGRSVILMRLLAVTAVVVPLLLVSGSLLGQTPTVTRTPAPSAKKGSASAFTPSRTPWGDPDLQGTYTNKDEYSIPFERPARFEGKQVDDIDDLQLAELRKERAAEADA